MDYQRLIRKRNLARKRMSTQQNVLNMRRSERSTAQSVFDKEFGESTEARGVLDAAMKKSRGSFDATATGKRFKDIAKFLGDENLDITKAGQIGRKMRENTGDFTKFSNSGIQKGSARDNYRDVLWSYKNLKRGIDSRRRDLNAEYSVRQLYGNKYSDFYTEDGRFIKTTKGRHETGGYGPFKFTYWNPFATNTEDKTGEIMAGLDSALQSRFESSGVKKQEDIIGFLTGSQRDAYGREQKASTLFDSEDYKKYTASFRTEQMAFGKEESEARQASMSLDTAKGRFSDAKSKYSELATDFANVASRVRKFERLGLADTDNLKSKRFKKSKAGAGSYL